ncbi:MAG: hypothetical protein PUB98_03840 [Clostridiales bacterium]|nr:hypothetical protein [Clostridiales bacterium]
MERSLAVTTKQLKKTFNGKEIIRQCNMSVEQGTIYGFLHKPELLILDEPVERKKILDAKLFMVFLYTVGSMFISGSIILVVFFITENVFPLCPDMLNVKVILNGFFSLLCYSCIAGLLGMISLWFGFKKKSIAATIIASCIIASIVSQILTTLFIFDYGVIGVLIVIFVVAIFVLANLHHQVRKMEV